MIRKKKPSADSALRGETPRVRLWGRDGGRRCGHHRTRASSGKRHQRPHGPPVLPERATWGCLPGPAGRGHPCGGQKWAELGRGSEATRTQGAGQESCAGVTGAAPLVAERVRVAWKEQARVRPVTATEDGLAGGSGNLRGGPSKGVNTPQPAGLQQLPAHTAPGHTETDGQLVDRQDVRT